MVHPPHAQTFAAPEEGGAGGTHGVVPARPMPPRTPYEEAILSIWRDFLGRSDIGIHDDFFSAGGHSLLAPKVVARIRKTLGVNVPVMSFFESPTIAGLAAAVAAQSSAEARVVTHRPPDADPVLSFDQQRLWLENQLLPGAAYNTHGRRRVVGPVDIVSLEASIREIMARHETLRTRFPIVDGQPVQVVDESNGQVHVRLEDVSGLQEDRFAAAIALADVEAATPFDLTQGPLFRCMLIRLSDSEHLLTVTMHHIISDAWSLGIFVRELSALYQAGGDADRAGLAALPIQYRDYAVWQRGLLVGETLERQVTYWQEHLAGAPPTLALPTARRRLPADGATGDRLRTMLSEQDTAALSELCRKQGVTTFMALLASLSTVLARWSGQPDVVIGVPIASRADVGTDRLIGFFVNTLPLRISLSGDPTFADLLGRVRQVALSGYTHADAPFDVLVKELPIVRDPRRTPVFQAVLNVIDSPESEQVSGVTIEPMETPPLPSKFDLALTAQPVDGALRLELDFNADRYQRAMMRILLRQVTTLLRAAMADPGRLILDYPLQPVEEASPIGERAPAKPRITPYPQRTAVIDKDGEWSYEWLSQAADRVAQAVAGHSTDNIGVVRRPTATFAAAVMGCLKAGATVSVIEAAGLVPAQFLGVSALVDVRPDGEVAEGTIDVSPLFASSGAVPAPDDTGGEPDWAVERFGLGSADRFAVLSGLPGHWLSALFTTFNAGGTLVIPGEPVTQADWLHRNAISVAYLSPPVLRALAAHPAQLSALRYAFIDNSGEFLPHDVDALRMLAPSCQPVGVYRVGRDGRPLAAYVVPDDWRSEAAPLRVCLGTELKDAPARLLHPSRQPAAIGEVAEICFGSYHTGDLGRRWPDGTLEFVSQLGANPGVDIADTAAALRDLPEIRDAFVTEHLTTEGATVLIGYVAGPLDTSKIRPYLSVRLPEYLIPAQLFPLDELPLTADGRYDVTALPQPDLDSGSLDTYVAPRTPMEHQLVEILQELLDLDRIGIHDSFFDLGGFSLLATRLTTRIREIFGVELSLRDVFEAPTVDGLAQLILLTQAEMTGIDDLEALLDEIGATGPERG